MNQNDNQDVEQTGIIVVDNQHDVPYDIYEDWNDDYLSDQFMQLD